MKKLFSVSILIFTWVFISGCSWICELFIVNTTEKEMEVEITLLETTPGFPIFYYPTKYWNKARTFPYHNKLNVDYEKQSETSLTSLNAHSYSIKIPAKSIIEIGVLHNDYYKKYNQEFINGRIFNLTSIKIIRLNDTLKINASQFDKHVTIGKSKNAYFTIQP